MEKREQVIEILDLPGDDSKETREKEHVERCLKQYLPHCTVCILMEISSQLVSLTQLEQEHVRDWQWQPSKFRIVLTRAVSDSSMKRRIVQEEFRNANAFRGAFHNELKRVLEDNKECAIGVYPLEFGDSWNDLNKKDELLFNRAKPMIDEIFAQLIEDLSKVYSPQNEIVQLLDLDGLTQKSRKEEAFMLKRRESRTKEEIATKHALITVLSIKVEKLVEAKKQVIMQAEEVGIWLVDQLQRLDIQQPSVMGFLDWSERTWSRCSVSSLRSEFDLASSKLEEEYLKILNKWQKSISALMRMCELPLIIIPFTFVMPTFGITRMIDIYLSKRNFTKDLNKCKYALNEANDEAFKQLTSNLIKSMIELELRLVAYFGSLDHKIQTLKDELDTANKQLYVLKNNAEQLKDEIVQSQMKWDHDENRIAQRKLYMRKSFTTEFRLYYERLIPQHVPATEKWLYLQYLNLMMEDMKWVESYEFRGKTEVTGR